QRRRATLALTIGSCSNELSLARRSPRHSSQVGWGLWSYGVCQRWQRRNGRKGDDVLRPIRIGAIQALSVGRPLPLGTGARPSLVAACDTAFLLIIGEESVQAARILSRWSRHEDAGADTAAGIRRRRQLGRAVLRKLLVEAAHFAPLHCRFGIEP